METRAEYTVDGELTPEQEYIDLVPSLAGVITHSEANRIVRRMREQRDAVERIAEQEAEEIATIRDRAHALREAHETRLEYLDAAYRPMLESFCADEIAGKKDRSVKLLSGTVGFRRGRSSLEITDEDAAMEWARENLTSAIVVKESLAKTPITDLIEGTGEVPPGCEYHQAEDAFYVKTG
jgi:phage host-nuclease inhibitor protein Gam